MSFKKYIGVDEQEPDIEDKSSPEEVIQNNDLPEPNEDWKYYNMVDPDTGEKYDIPLLSPIDPEYFYKYVDYMRMKEQSPETFEKILRWD